MMFRPSLDSARDTEKYLNNPGRRDEDVDEAKLLTALETLYISEQFTTPIIKSYIISSNMDECDTGAQ